MGISAEVVEAPERDLCGRVRELLSELRSPLATVRTGAELLIRSDLSELYTKRVARNVFAATIRLDEILTELAPFLGDAAHDGRGISSGRATTLPEVLK